MNKRCEPRIHVAPEGSRRCRYFPDVAVKNLDLEVWQHELQHEYHHCWLTQFACEPEVLASFAKNGDLQTKIFPAVSLVN